MAGLAAAYRLKQTGLRPLVLERESEPGGRARSEEWEGCTIELGAYFLTPAYRRLRRLIEECELTDRLTPTPNAFRTAIRRDGRWHYLDWRRPLVALARYRGISWRAKASLGRLVPYQLRVAPSIRFFDLTSAAAIDSQPLEAVIDPLANRYFASAIAEVFCGYAPEDVSLPFGVLGSRYPIRRAWSLQGGLGSLTRELGSRVEVRCGITVEQVRTEGQAVIAETSDGEIRRAGAAILATPARETLALWPEAPEWTRQFLGNQEYTQGFGVLIRTSGPVRRRDPSGRDLYMDVIPRGEGTDALLAVVYMNERASNGGLVAFAATPRAAAASSDATELAARLEEEFADLHPEISPAVTARRALHWPVFVPSYPVGRARALAAFRGRLGPGPIQIAGDYLYGPMMEAAVCAGEDAAGRASQHLGSQM